MKLPEKISSAVHFLGAWCIFALMVIGIIGIVSRMFGAPISGIISLSIFIFIGSVYLSLAYTQAEGKHVGVEFVVAQFPLKGQMILKVISAFLSVVGCFLLVWGIWPFAWESLTMGERMHGEPHYPLYPAKLCAAVGASIFLLQLMSDFIKAVKSLLKVSTEHEDMKRDEV